MTNFKGTKGKWQVVFAGKDIQLINSKDNEQEANALLISKAPEMLEMFEKLSIQFGSDGSIGQEIRKLIKEATTL